ncbi:Glutathione transport system permease protein gsiC [uncultured Flavonifractor sp.]|nr:Glutathione transport system permease protein gsiC [uncultured Flavonifractor sp.]
MLKYIFKRLLQTILMLLVLSFVVFFMVRLIPGDPVEIMLGTNVPKDTLELERERLGLNDPLLVQYGNFLRNALKGDLGTSIFSNKPVLEELAQRFPRTLILAVGGTVIAAVVGVVLGIISAVHQSKFWDNLIMVLSLVAVSTPSFFLALILMLIFGVYLQWLPTMSLRFTWQAAILPMVTLGVQAVGSISRTTRSAMLDVLGQDYIRTSRSRGIPERVVIYVHAFKNALIPVLTAIGLRFGGLLAGATMVETVFSISGIGRYVVDAVGNRDYPAVQGSVLVLAATFVVVNTVIDLLYSAVDPQVKFE